MPYGVRSGSFFVAVLALLLAVHFPAFPSLPSAVHVLQRARLVGKDPAADILRIVLPQKSRLYPPCEYSNQHQESGMFVHEMIRVSQSVLLFLTKKCQKA